jgi:excisionase family DNA binding protein
MTYPLSSRSTQDSAPNRFPVVEFEPLLDAIEAAALLRMHPKSLTKKARSGEIKAIRWGKCWHFRVSDLNEWVWSQQRAAYGAQVI